MKLSQISMWGLLPVALVFAGCQPKSVESVVSEESVEIGPKYSAKSGLYVPADTRLSLGIKIVEVAEEKVPATLDVQLRIYQTGKEHLLASANVTAEEAKALKPGLPVHAEMRGQAVTGSIERINAELLKATGMVEVIVKLSNSDETVFVGAFVKGSVAIGCDELVITIPRAALLESSDGHSVYTVSGENFVRAAVKVGAICGDRVEIKDGLYSGDQIVLQPVMSLWMTELASVKGGQACCAVPAKGK